MSYSIYLTCTTSLLIFLLLGASLIKDIGTVFEFLSAFAVSGLAFLFPGYFCIAAANKFASIVDRENYKCVLI